VRQQSEDKAYNKLHNLKKIKQDDPEKTIAVMGCVVGVRGNETLEETFPFVDVFMEPATDGQPLVAHLTQDEVAEFETQQREALNEWQDGEVILPDHQKGNLVASPDSIVYV